MKNYKCIKCEDGQIPHEGMTYITCPVCNGTGNQPKPKQSTELKITFSINSIGLFLSKILKYFYYGCLVAAPFFTPLVIHYFTYEFTFLRFITAIVVVFFNGGLFCWW